MTSINISLSMPVVSESTYKPIWAKTLGSNIAHLKKMLEHPTLTHIATSLKGGVEHKVFRVTLNANEDFYFVHDLYKEYDSIVYGVRVKTFDIKGLLEFKTLGQVSVWRNSYYSYLPSGFAKWIFKEMLYPTYGNILSDNSQSVKGKDFWYLRIGEEIDAKTPIYALGLETIKPHVLHLEEIHPISHIKDVDKFYSTLPDMRGEW